MAKRYVGSATIYVTYHDDGDYRGKIVVPEKNQPPAVWKFNGIWPPACGFGPGIAYDSPKAYDRVAEAVVGFGSYHTSMNQDADDFLDDYPSKEVAAVINDAVNTAMRDNGSYEVRRKKCDALSA